MRRLFTIGMICSMSALSAFAGGDGIALDRSREVSDNELSVEHLCDDYDFIFYDYMEGTNVQTTMEIYQSADGLRVKFMDFDMAASYDENVGLLSIESNQFLMHEPHIGVDVYFYHALWNDYGDEVVVDDEPLEGYFVGSAIEFDRQDLFVIGNKNLGNFFIGGVLDAKPKVKKQPIEEEGWSDLTDEALYVDGFVLPYAGANQYEWEYKVKVQKCDYREGVYRIRNPYNQESPLSIINEDKEGEGIIVFDISDPSYVKVLPTYYSGYTDKDGDAFCFNMEGYAYSIGGNPDSLKDQGITTFSYYDEKEEVVYFLNCAFSDSVDAQTVFFNPSVNPTGYLKLKGDSGVEEIMSKDNQGVAEYFDLTGRRVKEPAGNGVYLKRAGEKVTKIAK